MKLLIVNDDKITANIMKTEIPWEHHDIEVYVAYNVPEGQAIISGNQIDLLLCDIEMPDENGIALIRWIREKQFDIDCIFLTCHADFNYAKEAITLNCQDYLLMPTSYENIINTVLKVVRRRTERLLNNQLQEYGKSWLNSQQQIISENKESTRTPRELVDECTAYILQNLNSENLSVNEIASHFYLNPIYLNRIFKKEKISRSANLSSRKKCPWLPNCSKIQTFLRFLWQTSSDIPTTPTLHTPSGNIITAHLRSGMKKCVSSRFRKFRRFAKALTK